MAFKRPRAARIAASFMMFSSSAPVEKGTRLAIFSKSTSSAKGLALGVHLQDGNTPRHIGVIDENRAVKAAGTQQRGVKNVAAVRRRHDNNALVDCEAIHLDQQLVQRLLAFVVSAAQTRAAVATHGVNLINKDDGRGSALGLIEQVADAARAHAHEHLHKVRAGNGEERHARLARNRLCQQGFCPCRAGR